MTADANLLDSVGRTPLVELRHCSPSPDVRLFAKLEGQNPSGSVKDRIVREILLTARREGRLRPGDTLIEASTGNTGIALAMAGRALGYDVRVLVPDNAPTEISNVLSAYGASVQTAPADRGIGRAVAMARDLAEREGWFFVDQFANPSNIKAHYETTAPEILAEIGNVDVFVAGLGTGGTLMGAGRRLKEKNPETAIVAAEPHPGNQLQGLKSLSDGFMPPILDLEMLDGKILVRSHHAFRATEELMRREAIFAGISSGAVLHAAMKVASRLGKGTIVVVFADGGWKYLATRLWTKPPEMDAGEELDDVMWW